MANSSVSSASVIEVRAGKRRGLTALLVALGGLTIAAFGILTVGFTSPVAGSNIASPLSNLLANDPCVDPCVPGSEDIMKPKAHGTSQYPVQKDLRWGVDRELADRISNFNRHYAEFAGYWEGTDFLTDSRQNIENGTALTFYDSGWKGSPLFTVPIGRSWQDWLQESKKHGWPSFRDSEVDWDFARVLPGGEMVSIWGTHLGHNLPDDKGNRYCINLVSISGQPLSSEAELR